MSYHCNNIPATIFCKEHDITAKVDPGTGKITEYKVGVKIAFGLEPT